eukprot:538613-Pyramimonas_sp.AAC.1
MCVPCRVATKLVPSENEMCRVCALQSSLSNASAILWTVVHGSALVSYSAGISACEKCEQWHWALVLLSDMWEAQLEPSVFCTIITRVAVRD